MNNQQFLENLKFISSLGTLQKDRLDSMLGIHIVECSYDNKTIDFEFESQEWMLNPYSGIHGGIICSVFDNCMGSGSVALTQRLSTTTDISVSYLAPLYGKKYRVHVEYTQVGRTLVRSIGKIMESGKEKVCATAMASFILTGDKIASPVL